MLASDATIADVVPTLQNPEEYLRVVLQNMFDCNQKHSRVLVRIGITGTGQVPYHKVSFIDPDGLENVYAAYDGKHPFKDAGTRDSNGVLLP